MADPTKPRGRRMVLWLVFVPGTALLLALAGANWKVFHLAYCRHLLGSGDARRISEGLRLIREYGHVRPGMPYETVRRIMQPLLPGQQRVRRVGRFSANGTDQPGHFVGPVDGTAPVALIGPNTFDPPLAPHQAGYVDTYGLDMIATDERALRIEFRDDRVYRVELWP